MATLGDWKLGANGCRGASWSDERFGANILTTTPRRGLQLFQWYAEKVYSCAAASSTVIRHVIVLYV